MDLTGDRRDPVRYDIWVVADGQDRRHVTTAIAVLLGLDPRAAGKLLDSGAPLKRRLYHAEMRYFRVRFLDWGVKIRSEPACDDDFMTDQLSTSSPAFLSDPHLIRAEQWVTRTACQTVAGFAISMCAWVIAQVAFLPPFHRGGAIILVVASCTTGVFWGLSRPVLSLRSVCGIVAVFALLLAALLEGTPRIVQWFDTGRSSDFTDVAACLLFVGLCTALGAPLSAAVVARDRNTRTNDRPRGTGR